MNTALNSGDSFQEVYITNKVNRVPRLLRVTLGSKTALKTKLDWVRLDWVKRVSSAASIMYTKLVNIVKFP